jgi:hypothetical protein
LIRICFIYTKVYSGFPLFSKQIFKEYISKDEKEDNLHERENKRNRGNNLKTPKRSPNMTNSGTPIV